MEAGEDVEMKAIILLHEIYGINRYILTRKEKFQSLGFDVYCPDFYGGKVFDYKDKDAAYTYFFEHVGLEAYRIVWNLVDELKTRYESVFIAGYSVGATLAWRCSENPNCTGIVACYGSRIREYLSITPQCPVLLIFAAKDTFDVCSVVKALQNIQHTTVESFPAEHGFLDPYSSSYDMTQAMEAENRIKNFL